MSNPADPYPAEPCQPQPAIDPRLGLMLIVADHLVPLFASVAADLTVARQMALNAIDAYEPRTRADYVNVARTIAFSMSALALLGQAAAPAMPMAEKMRAFGRANALNRSADQSERTMMQRRHHQPAIVRADHPSPQDPAPRSAEPEPETEPDPVLDDAQVDAAVAEAIAMALGQAGATAASNSVLHSTAPARPTATAQPTAPSPEHQGRMTRTAPTAIHRDSPTPDRGHLQMMSDASRYQPRASAPHATSRGSEQGITPHPG